MRFAPQRLNMQLPTWMRPLQLGLYQVLIQQVFSKMLFNVLTLYFLCVSVWRNEEEGNGNDFYHRSVPLNRNNNNYSIATTKYSRVRTNVLRSGAFMAN